MSQILCFISFYLPYHQRFEEPCHVNTCSMQPTSLRPPMLKPVCVSMLIHAGLQPQNNLEGARANTGVPSLHARHRRLYQATLGQGVRGQLLHVPVSVEVLPLSSRRGKKLFYIGLTKDCSAKPISYQMFIHFVPRNT